MIRDLASSEVASPSNIISYTHMTSLTWLNNDEVLISAVFL